MPSSGISCRCLLWRFASCVAEKMLTYALGRGLQYYDVCAVDQLVQRMRAADYRFSSLVLGIVESIPLSDD